MTPNTAFSESSVAISLPSLMHSHADKLAKVQALLSSNHFLYFFLLQFSLWFKNITTTTKKKKHALLLLQERREARRIKVFWKICVWKWQFFCVCLLFFFLNRIFFISPIFTWSITCLHEVLFSHFTHSACQESLILRKSGSENYCFKNSIVLKSSWKRVPL